MKKIRNKKGPTILMCIGTEEITKKYHEKHTKLYFSSQIYSYNIITFKKYNFRKKK